MPERGATPAASQGRIFQRIVSGMAHEDDAKLVEEAVKEYLETK